MPVGLQLIGKAFGEANLARRRHALERALPDIGRAESLDPGRALVPHPAPHGPAARGFIFAAQYALVRNDSGRGTPPVQPMFQATETARLTDQAYSGEGRRQVQKQKIFSASAARPIAEPLRRGQ